VDFLLQATYDIPAGYRKAVRDRGSPM